MTSPHLHKDHPRTTKSEKIKLITNLIELPGPAWDKLFSYSFWRQIKTPKASRTVCPFPPPLPGMRLLYTVYDTHTHPPPSLTPASTLRDPPSGIRSLGDPRGEGLPAGLTGRAGSPGDPPATGSQSKTEREKNPRLDHRGGWRKAVGDFSRELRGPETTQFPFLPFSGARHAAQVHAPPAHPTHTRCLAHQST